MIVVGTSLVAAGAGNPLARSLSGWTAASAHDANCVVGSHAVFPVYDPVNHYVYVSNQFSGNVSVVKSVGSVLATLSLPPRAEPLGGAFDPVNDRVFVTDYTLNQV